MMLLARLLSVGFEPKDWPQLRKQLRMSFPEEEKPTKPTKKATEEEKEKKEVAEK